MHLRGGRLQVLLKSGPYALVSLLPFISSSGKDSPGVTKILEKTFSVLSLKMVTLYAIGFVLSNGIVIGLKSSRT